jgi:hypothetical protein
MGFAQDVKDFVSSITSGQGQNYVSDRERRANEATGQGNVQTGSGGPKRSDVVRPKLRPKTITVPSGGDDGGTRTMPFADYKPTPTNVPYFGGPNISPPTPAKERGFQNFKETFRNIPSSIATDLRLGIGSLSGPEGFTDALESLGFGTFRNKDGGISDEAALAYANFQQASRDSRDRQEAESMGDGDDNFYGNYDPCPEGYRTDPVTGMCVPVMGMSYETAPAAPAQYQGNFVDSPFPDLAGSGPASMPFAAPMNYTQPMNYTSPNIAPSSMAAQGMGIAGIPMTPILG